MTSIPISATNVRRRSISATTVGRIVTALPVLFLAFDIAIKFTHADVVAQSMNQLGYTPGSAPIIGIIELACVAIYLVPSTAVLGAVLLTGYLGGAIASHVRVGNPLFSHELFPTYIAALLWGGLYLREARLRALLPFRK
jgi:DoxX-like family